MGLYSGGLIIGRILVSEILGTYFREGLLFSFSSTGSLWRSRKIGNERETRAGRPGNEREARAGNNGNAKNGKNSQPRPQGLWVGRFQMAASESPPSWIAKPRDSGDEVEK